MGHAFVRDGFREGEICDASFAGVIFIGFFDSASFAAFAQNDGRRNADELDVGAVDDGEGEAIDGKGANDGLAIEDHIGVDEVGRLANHSRCQSQWFCIGPFDFPASGGSAQGDGRAGSFVIFAQNDGVSEVIRLVGQARRYSFNATFASAFPFGKCVGGNKGEYQQRRKCSSDYLAYRRNSRCSHCNQLLPMVRP